MMTKKERITPLFLFLSALLWSLSGVFTKSVVWNGLCLARLRGLIAFAVSAVLLRGHQVVLNRQKVLAALCYFVQGALFMCANKYTTAARHGAVCGGLCSGHRHTADLQRGGHPERLHQTKVGLGRGWKACYCTSKRSFYVTDMDADLALAARESKNRR